MGKLFPEYGCHVDLFDAPEGKPDDYVVNIDHPSSCIFAKTKTGRDRQTPNGCKYWRKIKKEVGHG